MKGEIIKSVGLKAWLNNADMIERNNGCTYEKIAHWLDEGLSDSQIAVKTKRSRHTINSWRVIYEETK